MDFTEEYEAHLLALESPVMRLYNQMPGLLDDDVLEAYDRLIKDYTRRARGAAPKAVALHLAAARVHTDVGVVCERLLSADRTDADDLPPLTCQELLGCLKKLRKSVRTWSAERGPQGYLSFIAGGFMQY